MPQEAVEAMPPSDGARFVEAHRALVSDGSIQFEMAKPKPRVVPEWLQWLADILSSPTAKYLLFGAIGLLLLYLLYQAAMRARGLRWRGRGTVVTSEAEMEWRPEAGPARALLAEADALAAQGLFSDAAHLLLFRSIEDIDARRPNLVRPALTSRDIAGTHQLPAVPRRAFSTIVLLVERSLFGGKQLVENDWSRCRAAYEEFAFAGAWN